MAKISYNPFTGNFDLSGDGVGDAAGTSLTTKQTEILGYLAYDSDSRILSTTRAFETTLNSLYLGGQHKMSSGAENIFFTNLGNDTNYYPMWGGLKDQSLAANQGETGFIPPSGRIYGNMFSLPLGGNPLAASAIGYTGSNYFGVNIAGLGITVELAEAIDVSVVRLEYRLSINDRQVYMQELDPPDNLYPGDQLEWFFDHPVEITAGTTIFAEIVKVSRTQQTVVNRATVDVTLGVLQVRMGDDGTGRYQTIVHNRLFEDKDLELISPYLKYQAMDFSVDTTGVSILLKDLSLAADSRLLIPHPINTLEAVATGTTIQIKQKGGAKIFVESLPVNTTSINGTFVNAVLNSAVAELNTLFTNGLSFAVQDNPVTTFALSGDDLTITLEDGTSFTSDVTTLGVDTDNFVTSAALSGTTITLTMDDGTSVFIPVSSLAIDNDTTITSGSVSGNTMSLTTNSGSVILVDVTSLATGSSTQVSSGAVVGDNLVLTMSDASTVTIDATNMINGSASTATNDEWFHLYGDRANQSVDNAISDLNSGVAARAPFYFGTAMARGFQFSWNANNNKFYNIGLWDGATNNHSGTFNSRTASNWSTCFRWHNNAYVSSSNTTLTNTTATGVYVTTHNAPVVIRFLDDGHLVLVDLSVSPEVEIARTINPLVETSIQMQLGCDAAFVFPNAIVTDANNIWNIVHDFAGTENGIIDGILDHTVLESRLSIVKGEKIMFHLDLNGRGISFGTGYNNASTGISTAETQLVNDFLYETNEALVLQNTNGSDWNINTNATYYFDNGTGNPGYRRGGANVRQGMFSLRFTDEGKLTIYSEDNNEKVATAKTDPAVGSSIRLYYAVKEDTDYASIPEISKQSLAGGQQPNLNFVATVADQTVTVEEGQALNFTVVTSDNIVNQFAEVDAPSWMFMNQNTGVLSGTAPAYLGTGADTIVVNCKAGNAIGGTVNFLVTVTVASYASTNTQSLQFGNAGSYLQGSASNISALQRTGNGSGASDAWSISMWFKLESGGGYTQTLFYYGGDDFTNEGRIELSTFASTSLMVRYGSSTDNIAGFVVGAVALDTWHHVLVTYDGGLTGAVVADVNNYYASLKLYLNGTFAVSQYQNVNGGFSGDINTDKYRIGRMGDTAGTSQFLTGKVDQIAVWGSDQQSNVATIYNSGVVQDLTLLSAPPEHYYEVEGSNTSILDQTGSAHLTAFGFTASDLASDSP